MSPFDIPGALVQADLFTLFGAFMSRIVSTLTSRCLVRTDALSTATQNLW